MLSPPQLRVACSKDYPFIIMQLQLDLTPPPKIPKPKLSPEIRDQRKEREEAHRSFKLWKSGKFKDFSEKQLWLLEKYYNIKL